ncbi:PilW family protein [Acinetobacter apis]|uniref:Type IV pilus assembly protein PilW n=1 Tax=Acinetobacter apis TaxID=1229165 RepID=A0A217EG69_9GAMM|nr:PilW family protein [Acinetobacter apis]SNQ29478.1 type IV pilus assembly protein PilW [Acinetobacter apis]
MLNLQKGFTLVELMASLVLGLLVSAAALALFFSAQRSYTLQQATSEMQENSNFALEYVVKNIRMANYNGSTVVNGESSNSGIVLTDKNLPGASTSLLTKAQVGFSNVSVKSDQLTIQYQVTSDQVNQGFFDCQGQKVTASRYVVERYFVREGGGLACTSNVGGNLSALSGNGELVIAGVDYFRVLLMIKNEKNDLKDISIAGYDGVSNIVGIQMGVIVRSNQSFGTEKYIDNNRDIQILDQKVKLNADTQAVKQQFLRDVVIQTVALRNALGS